MNVFRTTKLLFKKVIGYFTSKHNIYHYDAKELNDIFLKNRIKYNEFTDKIRIAFLFQMPSFWPNWESFYEEVKNDSKFEVALYLLQDEIKEHIQILRAKEFLDEKQLNYNIYKEELFKSFNPHVVVIQTPYDYDHRCTNHQSSYYMLNGHRVVYIPYGIEIADTENSRKDHFCNPVVQNCWRVFTFSNIIKNDYVRYGELSAKKIIVLGHPKFDRISHNKDNDFYKKLCNRINGRKVVVWHMHFVKNIRHNDKKVLCTPDIKEYYKFAECIENYSNLFFIILPHPKFVETLSGQKLIDICKFKKNVYIDTSDDYRPALCTADYMITDRSSLMIEVAVTKIPVLYLNNVEWQEPMTSAIVPIMNSYYHGTGYIDIKNFLEMCNENKDFKYKERVNAIHKCLKECDGKAGYKIKEYIKDELGKET